MNLEDYIKDLDPELQDKARACGSVEELVALAKEAKAPLPDEALAAIAGGEDVDASKCSPKKDCPKCGSSNTTCTKDEWYIYYWEFHCNDCGHNWSLDLGD